MLSNKKKKNVTREKKKKKNIHRAKQEHNIINEMN
jgi:hypothetical protein